MGIQKHVGLAGNPIAHSLSPVIHTAAYAALGLDWEYSLYPCSDETEFRALVERLAGSGGEHIGLNVTMPFKAAAFQAADRSVGHAAAAAGAANVLIFEAVDKGSQVAVKTANTGGAGLVAATANVNITATNTTANIITTNTDATITAANTDGAGIVGFLKRVAQTRIVGVDAIVCGTGATSTAAIVELILAGASSVVVLSRDIAQAQKCIGRIKAVLDPVGGLEAGAGVAKRCVLIAGSYGALDALEAFCQSSTLIIDATPIGMDPHETPLIPVEFITSSHTVLDVVYGFGETRLVREARARSARAFDGVGMLVEQAALSIEMWAAAQGCPCEAPRDIMHKAALDELKRRAQV